MEMKLKFKKLNDNAKLPVYATKQASGMDLHACLDQTAALMPGESAIVPTGIAIELPEGYEAQIRGRSGLAFKHAIFSTFGTIDADYRGELMVLLTNQSKVMFNIEPGMRVAQLVINAAVVRGNPEFVEEINYTERGDGGFGSTGYDEIKSDEGDVSDFHLHQDKDYYSTLDSVAENSGKINFEVPIAPQFRKGAPDQNQILDNLLNAGKGK